MKLDFKDVLKEVITALTEEDCPTCGEPHEEEDE